MKVLYFNYRDKKSKTVERKPLNMERLLFNAFLAVFIILLGVQAVLLNPTFRSVLTVDEGLEGSPLGPEEYLYNTGSMELRLDKAEGNGPVKVLVNGEERAVFESSSVIISVNEGDVVELDTTEAEGSVKVTISAVSDNISKECLGKTFQAEGSVLKLVTVRKH